MKTKLPLTAEDLRFASNAQLAEIFQVNPNVCHRWVASGSEPSVMVLRRASVYSLSVEVALEGIRLRRQDWLKRRAHKDTVEDVLSLAGGVAS
jgi:hypothetical protein